MRREATPDRPETSETEPRQSGRPPVQLGRLEQLLGYELRRAQMRVFQDFEAAMEELGLTPGQLGALFLIEANRGLSQSELGAVLGIDRSSVVPLIDRLQKRGWVRRAARASDRRAHALELAPAGVALLARLLPRLEAHETRIAAGLQPGERKRLFELLAKMAPR
ncbi:MAG: winged helix-turn-helix transcriptional regulator [Alphaproteobacteria bacterium]|nr:winged helix-turn-helix transcriptional regulator [Alphaproteobacteria bacterium]